MIIPVIVMSAIVYGSMITLLSIGFTLTHMTAKIPNFAHGTYAGFGVYVSFTFSRIYGYSPYLGFPVAIVMGAIIGILLYTLVVSTLTRMGGGMIVKTISTIALQIFMVQALHIYAYWSRERWGLYSYGFLLKTVDYRIWGYQAIFPISLIICFTLVILLHYMLTRTRFGIAMRATAEDPGLSSVLGINTHRIQQVSWMMTGAMACLAGAMLPLWFMGSPAAGGSLLISCMAGSLLGGLGSIYGAVIGGFAIGAIEILGTSMLVDIFGLWVGEYRPLVPMILTIAVLLIQPDGISGAIERWRIAGGSKRLMARLGRSSE